MRAIQDVEDWQPSPTVNTCIIRHRNEVHKYLYLWYSFASLYGHSFEDVQVQGCLVKQNPTLFTVYLNVLQQNEGPEENGITANALGAMVTWLDTRQMDGNAYAIDRGVNTL